LADAQTVVLHLKNGDRIAGKIVSQDTNRIVLTTSWAKEVAVPLSQIAQREGPSVSGGTTNQAPSVLTGAPVEVAGIPSTPKAATNRHWKVEARVGADFLYGAKDQEIYYARAKLTYQKPYAANPKQAFRNILDYSLDYGWTQIPGTPNNSSVVSANRMYASDKTDVDIGKKNWYVYDLAGGGYDQIRRIDVQYEVGPGLGYHLLTKSNLVVNTEGGLDYQAQYRSDQTTTKDLFLRAAEDVTWKPTSLITFTEKLELFPCVESSEYRARAEATVSYALWRHVSLNLSLLDIYDSQPAATVPHNDLQVHSSLGFTF